MSGRMEGSALAIIDLPEPGGADHQHVVRAGGGDLHDPLGQVLALDLGEIVLARGRCRPGDAAGAGAEAFGVLDQLDDLGQILQGVDLDAADKLRPRRGCRRE